MPHRDDRRNWTTCRTTLLAAAAAALLCLPAPASGQGFGIYEQGTCAMGRAGSAVAQPCGDGSSIFFNPAGLGSIGDPVASLGVTEIFTTGDFTPDGAEEPTDLDNRPIPVPHAFFAFEPATDWTVGIGVYAPYGLETSWPLDFEGRFAGYDNALRTAYVQPTVTWTPDDRVSVGVGVVGVWSEVEINRREDLATTPVPEGFGAPPGATFGDLNVPLGSDFVDIGLEGGSDGLGFGAHLGVLVDVTPDFRVGGRYLTRIEVEYDGDADFTPVDPGIDLPAGNPFGAPPGTPLFTVLQNAGIYTPGGPLSDTGVSTSIDMPQQLVLGLAWDATPALSLSADWQWTGWEAFDSVRIDFENDDAADEILVENYESTHGIRLGLDWSVDASWALRGGWVWHQAAAPDETVTPLLPENERNSFTAGVGWSGGGWGIDAGYMLLLQEDRRGRVRNAPPGEATTTALNSGLYAFDAHLVGVTVRVGF